MGTAPLEVLLGEVNADPGDPVALIGLARALHERGEDQAGLRIAQQLVAVAPRDAAAWTVYGALLAGTGHYGRARHALLTALSIAPGMPAAHWNLAGIELLLGDPAGWEHYQWGRCNGMRPVRRPDPEWVGQELRGQRLVLWCEQGYGDTIQMLRYVPWVRERARYVELILEVQPGLGPLCMGIPGLDLVMERAPDKALPAADEHCSLMSLPGLFQGAYPTRPYLSPVGRAELPAGEELLRGGLVWRGAAGHANDRNRSLPVDALEPLREAPVEWFSLQLDHEPPAWATDLGQDLRDWSQTAALLAALDLVVTCDTAVAHLAGALGRPALVLLPRVPDWRWGLASRNSYWYPSLRLFRQQTAGCWDTPIRDLVRELGGPG